MHILKIGTTNAQRKTGTQDFVWCSRDLFSFIQTISANMSVVLKHIEEGICLPAMMLY